MPAFHYRKLVNKRVKSGAKIYIHPIVIYKVVLRLFSAPFFPLDRILKPGEKLFENKLNRVIRDSINRGDNDYFKFGDVKINVPEFKDAEEIILNDFREVYLESVYTKHFIMGKPFNSGDTILDLGANIGGFSLWAASMAENLRIISIEAHPQIFSELVSNISANNLDDSIIPIQKCIAEEDGFQNMMFDSEVFTMTRISDDESSQKIESISIDSLVSSMELPRIDFIKFDIEGAERIAISGAKETLKNHKPKLALSGYHLVDDVYFLIDQIMTIQPEYKIIVGSNMHIYAF